MKTRIFIFVALFAAVFMLQSQTQVGQNLWGDAMHDRFGWSVGIGNTDGSLAVGVPYADVNGTSSGLARMFQFDGTSWSQRGNDINGENAGDEFGQSIDLNDDGQVNVIDIVQLVNFILNINIPEPQQFDSADLNNDEVIDVLDIVTMVNMIMGR